MPNGIDNVKNRLIEGGFTCVVHKGEEEYTSTERGVTPLVLLLESGKDFSGSVAADKTVGAGAAHLYILLGTRSLWANVISAPALSLLTSHGITVTYGECVPNIINRKGDGICPFEAAVLEITAPAQARAAILAKMKEMGIQ